MIFQFLKRQSEDPIPRNLYESIVAQARQPVFYEDFYVPDTVMGRFDMIVLHAVLLFRKLKGKSDKSDALAQAVYDWMWKDMDRSIRELGVGDPSVPKRMKLLTGNYFARLEAYNNALDHLSLDELVIAIKRFMDSAEMNESTQYKMANYILKTEQHLVGLDIEDVMGGRLEWISANRSIQSGEAQHD